MLAQTPNSYPAPYRAVSVSVEPTIDQRWRAGPFDDMLRFLVLSVALFAIAVWGFLGL